MLANELPMNIISIHPSNPFIPTATALFVVVVFFNFYFAIWTQNHRRWSNRHHYRVYLRNLLQTHLHNVSIVYRSSRSSLTHTHAHRSRSTPSYVSFFTNERYICKLNFDMFVLTINLEWTFTVANQSGSPDTTQIICIYICSHTTLTHSLTHNSLEESFAYEHTESLHLLGMIVISIDGV